MQIELSESEASFLRGILGQLTVNPSNPDALAVVTTVQAILGKLNLPPVADLSNGGRPLPRA